MCKKGKRLTITANFQAQNLGSGKKIRPVGRAVSEKAGPVMCVWIANQIRGFRIPARSDAREKNKLFLSFTLWRYHSFLITFFFCPFNYTEICWCMTETSSDLLRSSSAIFGTLRKMFGNVRKVVGSVRLAFGTILENLRKEVGNLRIIVKSVVISMFVVNSISHLFAALTRGISSWTLENKIRIHARACNILYNVSIWRALWLAETACFIREQMHGLMTVSWLSNFCFRNFGKFDPY